MRSRTLAAALTLLCAAAPAWAQATPSQTPTPQTPAPAATPQAPAAKPSPTPDAPKAKPSDAKKKYEALLEKAKRGEGAVDYGALRLAFFETEDYSPLAGMMVYRPLWGLVGQSNWAEAVKLADSVLEKNYVDANAHMVAYIARRELKEEEKAALHRRWAEGLLESIKTGGDGKSPQTAWHVISISEEYAVLRSMNLNPVGQALVNDKGHSYDVMTVTDPQSRAESRFFFNVDKPFSAYGRK
jgi:hypothetical protein